MSSLTRHAQQTVANNFGFHASRVHAPQENVLRIARPARIVCVRVKKTSSDRYCWSPSGGEWLSYSSFFPSTRRQPIKQFGMARGLSIQSEINNSGHDWFSKVPHPKVVDGNTRCQRIIPVHHPACQRKSSTGARFGILLSNRGELLAGLGQCCLCSFDILARGSDLSVAFLLCLFVGSLGQREDLRQLLLGLAQTFLGFDQMILTFGLQRCLWRASRPADQADRTILPGRRRCVPRRPGDRPAQKPAVFPPAQPPIPLFARRPQVLPLVAGQSISESKRSVLQAMARGQTAFVVSSSPEGRGSKDFRFRA